LISEANVVVSGGRSNGSDLLFRTTEWKRISIWTGCETVFFFAGYFGGGGSQGMADSRAVMPSVRRDVTTFNGNVLALERLGGRTRARTWDPMIKSSRRALLCSFQMHAMLRR
jgi:hypothetical protein